MSTADQIVASALQLFYRNGFHASGVDLLAEQAGVTKKTLYRYYPSKDALIEAALALRHQHFIARLRDEVECHAVEARPLAYIDFILSWTRSEDFQGCAFINASAEYGDRQAAPHRQAAAHKQEIRAYLQSLCQAAGARRPDEIASELYLLGEGVIVSSQVQGPDTLLAETARKLAANLWKNTGEA